VIPAPVEPRITPKPREGDAPMLNIFATLGKNEPLAKGFYRLGGHLLQGGALPERERELVILRAGWRSGSEYEFGQHTAIGQTAGLTMDEIRRVADCGSGSWGADDQALVNLVDELCDENVVSETTWRTVSSRFNDSQMLELLVLTGFYRLVSGLLNSVGVALEPNTAGWPEGAHPIRRAPRTAP
jgi:4-carboxymuconolactone decarboxylase